MAKKIVKRAKPRRPEVLPSFTIVRHYIMRRAAQLDYNNHDKRDKKVIEAKVPYLLLPDVDADSEGRKYHVFVFGWNGVAYFNAGCRCFTFNEAVAHWSARHDMSGVGTEDESRAAQLLCRLKGKDWLKDEYDISSTNVDPDEEQLAFYTINRFVRSRKLIGFMKNDPRT